MKSKILEIKIAVAKAVMVFSYRVARMSADWMAKLILSRSPKTVMDMEIRKGIHHG